MGGKVSTQDPQDQVFPRRIFICPIGVEEGNKSQTQEIEDQGEGEGNKGKGAGIFVPGGGQRTTSS